MADVVSEGQEIGTPIHPNLPGSAQGKESSQAYRQDLRQRVDAIDVNLGTPSGSPIWE
jgi:hypothetical protein